mgnify:CR=1 FL=1
MSPTDHPPAAPPIPSPDERTQGFWDQTAHGVLTTQRCDNCGHRAYPPTLICTNCLVDPAAFSWAPVAGTGRLATWTIIRDALLPGFADLVPYAVAEVELPEQDGLRVLARLQGADFDDLEAGLHVAVAFVDGGEGTQVPVFEPVRS